MNSRGEFNRCYIPRLRIVEEEEVEGKTSTTEREQNRKTLREQDRNWENSRIKELGTSARMGPSSSPQKRRLNNRELKDQELELEDDGATKKGGKRARKHEVLEERWGEHIVEGTKELPEDRELVDSREEPNHWHKVPRELSLTQLVITGFLNPAPSLPPECPTLYDGTACGEDDPPPPLKGADDQEGANDQDQEQLEGGKVGNQPDIQDVKLNRSMEDDLLDTKMKDDVALIVDEQNDDNMKTDDPSNMETMPSVKNNTLLTKNECVIQRGGRCKIHGIIGSKSTINKKSWSKLKNGIHGWKYSKVIKYSCPMSDDVKDDVVTRLNDDEKNKVTNAETRLDEVSQNRKSTLGLGLGKLSFPGRDIRISGVDTTTTGCGNSNE